MDFSITNYKPYKPVKVINITESGTKAIYTFIGNLISPNIRSILENQHSKELSKKNEVDLQKEFGTHWKKVLGFPKSQKQRFASANINYFQNELSNDDFSSDSLFDTIDSNLESIPDVQEQVQETVKRKTGLNFIFDFINSNDSIEIIKKKIFAYTNIPVIAQHIFYKRDNPVLKGDIETVVLDYKIIDLTNKFRVETTVSRQIPIDILNNTSGTVPIDKNFADNVKNYLIRNTMFMLLADFDNFENEIFLADINTFIPSIVRMYSEDMYKGYILKYFPSIPFNLVKPILNNTYTSPEQPNTIKRNILQTQKQINTIKSLELQNKKLDINISNVLININYPFESNIKNLPKPSDSLLNLRNVFELLETSENMPFIRNKFKTKVDKNFYNTNPSLVRRNWMSSTESVGLVIKLRLSNDSKDPRYAKFMSITLYSDGKIDVKITFPIQMNISNETMINEAIDRIESLASKINKYKEAFVKPLLKLQLITVKIASISSIYYPKLLTEMMPTDYSMLQCLSKAFDMYIIPDHEVQRGNMAVTFRFVNKSFSNIETVKKAGNEMIGSNNLETIQKNVFSSSTNIEISQSPAKVVVKGSGNTVQTNRLLNFLERFFYYFRNPEGPDNYVQSAYQQCQKRIPRILQTDPDDISKGSKRIRILKDIDPRTFNYKATTKFDPYSKKCQQNNQQPLVYTDEQFAKLTKKPDASAIVKITNKTRPSTHLTYVCDNNTFKFPGFLTKDQHPDGLCMPCCYRTNSRTNPSQKKYRKFQQCLRAESADATSSSSKSEPNDFRSYITSWKSNEIEAGRYSKIPYQMADLLNINDECRLPNNLLITGSICFLIPGLQQDINSFIKTVSMCFDDSPADLVEMLKESPDLFDVIENGEVKRRFTTFNNFVEYLNNNIETVNDIYVKDLLSIKYNVHIAIFTYESEDITVTCSPKLDSINNQDTIIIIKAPKSDFTTFYYPIWKVSLSNQKKTFSSDSRASNSISKLYQSLCNEINKSQQAGIMFDAKFVAKMAKVTAQVVYKERPKYLIINDSFSIPVNIDSFKLPNVPIVKEPVLGNVEDISAWLEELQDPLAIYINRDARVLNHSKNKVIGYFLNTNYFVPTKHENVKNVLPNDYIMLELTSPIPESKRLIIPHKKLAEQDAKYRNDYKDYVKEITLNLNIEKNADVHNKIKNIIKKYPERNGDNFRSIVKAFNTLNILPSDAKELEQILLTVYSNKKLSFIDLISTNRFGFDNITKDILNKAIKDNNRRQIIKIIKELSHIKVSSDFQSRIVDELLLNDYQRFSILNDTDLNVKPSIKKNELIFIN